MLTISTIAIRFRPVKAEELFLFYACQPDPRFSLTAVIFSRTSHVILLETAIHRFRTHVLPVCQIPFFPLGIEPYA